MVSWVCPVPTFPRSAHHPPTLLPTPAGAHGVCAPQITRGGPCASLRARERRDHQPGVGAARCAPCCAAAPGGREPPPVPSAAPVPVAGRRPGAETFFFTSFRSEVRGVRVSFVFEIPVTRWGFTPRRRACWTQGLVRLSVWQRLLVQDGAGQRQTGPCRSPNARPLILRLALLAPVVCAHPSRSPSSLGASGWRAGEPPPPTTCSVTHTHGGQRSVLVEDCLPGPLFS